MGKKREGLIRAVIDTNVFISSVLYGGLPGRLLDYWKRGKFIYLISRPILEEYIKVLSYPEFQLREKEIKCIIQEELLPYVEVIKSNIPVSVIKTDPSGNLFLSAAIEGKASFIVSEVRHLSTLEIYRDIEIIEVRDFLTLFGK